MAITKKEFVLSQMERLKLPFYTIKDGTGLVDDQQEDIEVEEAIQMLSDSLDAFGSGVVEIKLSNRNKASKRTGGDLTTYTYKVKVGNENTPAINGNTSSNLESFYEERMRLEKKIIELENNQKFEALKREIESVKNNEKSVFDHPMVQNVIAGLMGAYGGAKVAETNIVPIAQKPLINGTDTEVKKISKEEQKLIGQAISRINAVDPDMVSNFLSLATLAESNPTMYFNAVSMMKSFIK